MSLKLSNGESILREYTYAGIKADGVAKSSATSKTLIVTNKRIVHHEVSAGIGSESIRSSEIPVESAKYVSTYYGMKSYTIFLVMASIFILAGILLLALAKTLIPLVICAIIALVFILIYIFKKDYYLSCTISTDTLINDAMHFTSKTDSNITRGLFAAARRAQRGTTIRVKVTVNKDVAKLMAEELSAVINDAASGVYDNAFEEVVETEEEAYVPEEN